MFVHLHLHSPYSFLDGASDLETLVRQAASFGMPALALTDHDSLCAAVKFSTLCRAYGIQPILGAEVTMEDQTHLTLLAQDRAGYANLCRMLTHSFTHGGRLTPHLPWRILEAHAGGLFCLSGCRKGRVPTLVREHRYEQARTAALHLRDWFGPEQFFLELQDDFTPDCGRVNRDLVLLAKRIGAGVVATNNVHYARREDFITHDVLRCIAAGSPTVHIHPSRPLNAERYLKSARQMEKLFAWCPEALASTLWIADQCTTALPEREAATPHYPTPQGQEASAYLRHLAYKGAKARYRTLTAPVTARLEHELGVICTLGYADYFLHVFQIVRWARKAGIRCTGRGSAADSCVAYALQLTDVDVIARSLPFARFLSPGKTPDIDMDFPADRREDVFRHIIETYGEEHVGMVCTFHTFWARSAVRDVGKALGLPPAVLALLSERLSHFIRADRIEEAFETYAELKPLDPFKERFKLLLSICARIAGFPRHLGTHSSGVVLSRLPLSALAPLSPSARGLTRIWTLDKDDAEATGAIKFDVLSLRALSAVGDVEEDIAGTDPAFSYDRIPMDDPATYWILRSGGAVGSFQFESAAQLTLAATLQPEHFEDLVASVALIRPGPVRGNVVQRYLACRTGWLRADLLHPALEPALSKTFGCIVFQEQVSEVVAVMTGCTDAEADAFRKRLVRHDKVGTMQEARAEFIEKSLARYPDVSVGRLHRLFDQIEGWGGYGFTEGHAASFALIGYKTAYLSVHHAAAYFAGLLNHQPMGYYSPNSLAAEARRRGVLVLPVDINKSRDRCCEDEPGTIRLGLRLVEGLREEDIITIVAAREQKPFASLLDFCVRVPLHRHRLENLVLCGAFDTLHLHRRGLLWRLAETIGTAGSYRAEAAGSGQKALGYGGMEAVETPVAADLAPFTPWESLLWGWRITGVAADCHPFAYVRERLERFRVLSLHEAARQPGRRVTVAGLNIRPHRPPTRSGRSVLFTCLEDETGLLQAVCVGEALETCTSVFLLSPVVLVRGVIERKGSAATLRVEKAKPLRLREWTNVYFGET